MHAVNSYESGFHLLDLSCSMETDWILTSFKIVSPQHHVIGCWYVGAGNAGALRFASKGMMRTVRQLHMWQ
jgi:hypothetical protein